MCHLAQPICHLLMETKVNKDVYIWFVMYLHLQVSKENEKTSASLFSGKRKSAPMVKVPVNQKLHAFPSEILNRVRALL